ncbi:DsbA family protein [Lichenicoccus sp.]|uniref:DsbA family protein n=1 Tax=Lichenicoccus sp. TaxID=2781899 RepID=UPI003D14B3DB
MRHIGRLTALAAFSMATLALDAGRAHADGFTPSQRQEIIAIVRQALKADPSILSDAIISLRAHEEQAQASDSAAAIQRNQAALTGAAGDEIAGDANGRVTLVEFYDPRCPYCRKSLPELDELLSDDPKLRLVEKLIPILGPDSVLEARAIAAAGRQGKYAVLQHALMTDPGQPDAAQIRAIAGRAGLNVGKLQHDMADPAIDAQLHANVALARTLGISGTPSFVIGSRIIPGAVDLGDLRAAVASARAG